MASRLFLERGFDAVTVAEVAKAAGVSSVTVFNHFPRKEDLFLDRAFDAGELLREAVRRRPAGVDVVESLQQLALRLAGDRHALSGLDPRSVPFFRTVAESPALVARAREIASELEGILAEELERDPTFDGDAGLLAALFVAGYGTILVATARRVMAGESAEALVDGHRERFERLFDALRNVVAARS